MKDTGLDGSYDGIMEAAPTSPIDRGPIISPPRTPVPDIEGDDAPTRSPTYNSSITVRATEASSLKTVSEWILAQDLGVLLSSASSGSEELAPTKDSKSSLAQENKEVSPDSMVSTVGDRTLEASSGRYDSAPSDDSEEQGVGYPCAIRPNPTTELGDTITATTSRAQPIPAAIVLATDMPQTETSGSESRSADMRQFGPEKRSYGPFIVKEGVLVEGVSESRVGLQAAELDNETPITPISASGPFATTEIKETGTTTIHSANTPNLEAPERDYTETPIRLLKPEGVKPAARTEDMAEKPSSARVNIEPTSAEETQDDDECQFILARSRLSPPAVPITPKAQYRLTHHRRIETFLSLLRVAYYEVPIISHTDMGLALFQTENLIAAAKFYRALETVVAPIGNSLAQGGHLLFYSITLEPVRWLNISIDLKNKIIFQEASIHLVSRIPNEYTSEAFSGIPRNVLRLLQRKYREMDEEISRVSRSLSAGSIYESGIRADLTDKSSFDMWALGCIWREWFATNFEEAKTEGRHPEEPTTQSKLGSLYRTIYAGGDAYLPKHEVLAMLRPLQKDGADQTEGFLQWGTAEFDLTQIKYARKMVQNLCYNRSQLDPSEAGFSYLTCTHIGDDEFPWVSAMRN